MRVSSRVKLPTCARMFTSLWIFEIFMVGVASGNVGSLANVSSLAFDTGSCEEFGQDDRISAHGVVKSLWRIFYFWAEGMEISTILFGLPSEKKLEELKYLMKAAYPDVNVSWDNATLFMEPRLGVRVLFLSDVQNGSYSAIVKIEETREDGWRSLPRVQLATVRMKMAGRILGIVNCIDHTAFALARLSEMPRTKSECTKAAARLGLNTRFGKPYLDVVDAHDEL